MCDLTFNCLPVLDVFQVYSRQIKHRARGIFSVIRLTSAVVLVAVVRAVLASVTSPAGWDAHTVLTLEPRGWTLGHQSFYKGHMLNIYDALPVPMCIFLFMPS